MPAYAGSGSAPGAGPETVTGVVTWALSQGHRGLEQAETSERPLVRGKPRCLGSVRLGIPAEGGQARDGGRWREEQDLWGWGWVRGEGAAHSPALLTLTSFFSCSARTTGVPRGFCLLSLPLPSLSEHAQTRGAFPPHFRFSMASLSCGLGPCHSLVTGLGASAPHGAFLAEYMGFPADQGSTPSRTAPNPPWVPIPSAAAGTPEPFGCHALLVPPLAASPSAWKVGCHLGRPVECAQQRWCWPVRWSSSSLRLFERLEWEML